MALDYKLIGKRINKARKRKGYTQKELGKKIGVSTAFLSRVERGTTKANMARFVQMSEALNVPLSYFFNGSVSTAKGYLSGEFKDVLKKCDPEKQKAILKIAKIISKV